MRRQKRRLDFYVGLESLLCALFIYFLAAQFLGWLQLAGYYFSFLPRWSEEFLWFAKCGVLMASLAFFLRSFIRCRPFALKDLAGQLERQSEFFKVNPKYRSELASAASFLDHQGAGSEELRELHIREWSSRLEEFRLELRPRFFLGLVLGVVLVLSVLQASLFDELGPLMPDRHQAWTLTAFEEKIPVEGSEWQQKSGSLATVEGARVRFKAPPLGPFRTILFLKEGDQPWRYQFCQEYCEWKVKQRGVFSVGSFWARSHNFPLHAVPDEAPRSVLLVKEGTELVPHATVRIQNQKFLDIQVLASDDLQLKQLTLLHREGESLKPLVEWNLSEGRVSKDFRLDLSQWKGGEHQVIARARDHLQSKDSLPLTIIYADEEYLRAQRMQSLQNAITEWVHVLGDLLETQEDQAVSPQLADRLKSIQYPADVTESSIRLFIDELTKLGAKIQKQIVEDQRLLALPGLIIQVEKQILYGLSLLFKEKAGDVKDSVAKMESSKAELQKLLEEMKQSGKVDPEKLEALFEELQKRLKELQEKMANLPDGPQDDLVNRQALEQQLGQSQELEEKIAEIQKQIQEGKGDQALRELQSLINQLSILNKEIGRSFEQWQENLDQGALEAAQKYNEQLQKLQAEQMKIAEDTKKLAEELEALKKDNPVDSTRKERADQIKEDSTKLQKAEEALRAQMEESAKTFEEALKGSQWEQLMRPQDLEEAEQQVLQKMSETVQSTQKMKLDDAHQSGLEAAEGMRKMSEKLSESQQQMQQMAQQVGGARESKADEKVEIIDSEAKGEKERRRRIMDSLRQQVEERYQKSHERYFEDLLQR